MPTLSRTFPIARKAHRCGSCGGSFPKGTRYHRWKGTSDYWHGVATLIECAACAARHGRPIPDPAPMGDDDGD